MQEASEKSGHLNPACGEFEAELSAYLEGDPRTSVRAHVAACSECRSIFDELALIRKVAGELPPVESPSPRVWANLRAALEAEGRLHERPRFWQPWLMKVGVPPALAPLGALAGLVVFGVIMVSSPQTRERPFSAAGAGNFAAENFEPGYTAAEASLARTVEQMEESYKAREDSFDPSAKVAYEKGLDSLDASIRECSASLERKPQNQLAREYLMNAYAQKADILASALEYQGP